MRQVFVALLVCAAMAASSRGFAGEDVSAVVVLDTTAQMATRLGQKRKLDLVKNALPDAMRGLDAASRVTLWAFGTHPAQKCEDSRELVPFQPPDKAGLAAETALAGVSAQAARAPLLATLRAALNGLGDAGGRPVTAVLVAGAADDCANDMCADARALKKLYPSSALTVIGMGMNPAATGALTCAANAMGGVFLPVKSAAEFGRALEQALALRRQPKPAKTGTAAPGEGAPPQVSQQLPRDTPAQAAAPAIVTAPPAPEPNVELSATLTEGSPPIEAGLTWRAVKIELTPTGQRRLAETATYSGGGGTAKFKLPAGDYIVEAAYGLARARVEITAGEEKIGKNVIMDAGIVAVQALRAKGAAPVDGAFFILYRQGPGGGREEIARSSAEPAIFYVNAGDYTLRASAGFARVETAITALPGKVSALDMVLNAGTLEVKAFLAENRTVPVAAAWHRLYGATLDPGAGGAPLAVLQGPLARVQLPEGNYRLETIYGSVHVETALIVTAGQLTSQSVMLNAGEVRVSPLQPGAGPATGAICSIYDAGADPSAAALGKAAGSNITFAVKAGAYDVGCEKNGVHPDKKARIEVPAGTSQTVTLPK